MRYASPSDGFRFTMFKDACMAVGPVRPVDAPKILILPGLIPPIKEPEPRETPPPGIAEILDVLVSGFTKLIV